MNLPFKALSPKFQGLAAHPRHEHAHALIKGVANEFEN